MHHHLYIKKIFLCVKNPYKPKYHYLIKNLEEVRLKHCKDPKAFIENSNDMKDVYNSIKQKNTEKKRNLLIVFDDFCWYDQ